MEKLIIFWILLLYNTYNSCVPERYKMSMQQFYGLLEGVDYSAHKVIPPVETGEVNLPI